MVQFFKGSKDPRDEAYGKLAEALGGGLGEGINTYYANKAFDDVVNDPELKDAPQQKKLGELSRALAPYGKMGQHLYQTKVSEAEQEYKEKQLEAQRKESQEAQKRLFEHQKSLQTQKDTGANKRAATRPPAGGIGAQPIPPEQVDAIEKYIKENPEADADQLAIGLGKAGVNPSYSNPYIENRRRQDEAKTKNTVENNKITDQNDIKFHQESKEYEEGIRKQASVGKKQMEIIDDITKDIKEGKIKSWSLSSIFKGMGSIGEKISNALLNKSESKLLSAIPEFLEGRKELFGVRLSDADLKLLQDKLPDMTKSKEANLEILGLMRKYASMSILKETAAKNVLEREGVNYREGKLRPINYESRVEKEFDKLVSEKGKFKDLPSASEHKGKKIKDHETGKFMISNGTSWEPA